MREHRDKEQAELAAMRQGMLAHQRFKDARAAQGRGGMRRSVDEHAAINRQVAALIERV